MAEQPPSSLQMAVARDPAVNFALVSVPGAYAAAEALKALRLGMSVMVFSDNVPEDAGTGDQAVRRASAG